MNKIFLQPINFGSIVASANEVSDSLDLARYANAWKFSLQLIVTGAGTVTISLLVSNDGANFYAPDTPNVIVNFTVTDGPDGDGKSQVTEFALPLCKYLQVKATETGGAAAIVPRVEVCIQ